MLRNRLAAVGVTIFASFTAVCVLSGGWLPLFCLFALTVSCLLFCAIRFLRLKTAVIYALIPLFAVAYFHLYTALFVPGTHAAPITDTVTGTVETSASYFSQNCFVITAAFSEGGLPPGTKIKIYTDFDAAYVFGDIIRVKGTLYPADKKPKLLAEGIKYYVYGETAYVGKGGGVITNLRRSVYAALEERLPEKTSSFLKAITLGDTSRLDLSRYALYGFAGVSHMLSVSGLHLSVLVMAFYFVIKRFFANNAVLSAAGIFLAFFASSLAGFTYSSLRAALMLCLFFLGRGAGRNADAFTSLFVAFGILLLLNPYSAASLSLILSFLSTLGIITINHTVSAKRQGGAGRGSAFRRVVSAPVLFSFSSFVFTLPVAVTAFGKVSVISPLANIAAGLIFTPILVLSYVFALSALISPVLAAPFAFVLTFLVRLFDVICTAFAALPFAALSAYSPFVHAATAVGMTAAGAFLLLKRKARLITLAVTSGLLGIFVIFGVLAGLGLFDGKTTHVLYKDTVKGFSVYISGGKDGGALVDYGGDDLSDELPLLAGKTACQTLVIAKYGPLSAKKAKYYLTALHTRLIYLKKPQSEEEGKICAEISLLAKERKRDIIIFEDAVFSLGRALVSVTEDGLLVAAEGKDIVFPAGMDSGLLEENKVRDTIFLPSCFFKNSRFPALRTKRLFYGGKAPAEIAGPAGRENVYEYYSAVPLEINPGAAPEEPQHAPQ